MTSSTANSVAVVHFGDLVSEIATDVPRGIEIPPGMMYRFCPVTRTAWHIDKDDPWCPGCGSKLGDLH